MKLFRLNFLSSVWVFFQVSICIGASETIYSHTFDEGPGALNGTAVDLGSGNWIAGNVITANGAFSTGPGSATLPFLPSNGLKYHLDARILNVTGNSNWIALGFANSSNNLVSNNNRFITTGVVGTAWMLFRGDNSIYANQTFLGSGALSPLNQGIQNPGDWATLNNNGGNIDLRIVLDTTGGDGSWTVTWLAKLITEQDYTEIRSATPIPLEDQPRYTSVGIAFSTGGEVNIQGTLASFSLTSSDLPGESPAVVVTIKPAPAPGTGFNIEWVGQANKRYNLRTSTDLVGPISSWELLEGNIAASFPKNLENVPTDGIKRFYAVEEFDASVEP